jgi:hypothetical protein
MEKANMTNQEFKDRIRVTCGLKPSGYYNPPREHQPTHRNCQCAECVKAGVEQKEAA